MGSLTLTGVNLTEADGYCDVNLTSKMITEKLTKMYSQKFFDGRWGQNGDRCSPAAAKMASAVRGSGPKWRLLFAGARQNGLCCSWGPPKWPLLLIERGRSRDSAMIGQNRSLRRDEAALAGLESQPSLSLHPSRREISPAA